MIHKYKQLHNYNEHLISTETILILSTFYAKDDTLPATIILAKICSKSSIID